MTCKLKVFVDYIMKPLTMCNKDLCFNLNLEDVRFFFFF